MKRCPARPKNTEPQKPVPWKWLSIEEVAIVRAANSVSDCTEKILEDP